MKNSPRPAVSVYGTRYELLGTLAEGEFCDVYLARRPDPLQLVVIKAAREPTRASLRGLQNETRSLSRLWTPTDPPANYFKILIPELVVAATEGNMTFEDGGARTHAIVYRWRPGFSFTFEDVRRAYPDGIPARAAVWFFKRSLDTLAWLHENHLFHTAAVPSHFLVNPLEHGVAMAGFSRCFDRRFDETPPVPAEPYRAFYPKDVLEGGRFTADHDIMMAARSLFYVCGGSFSTGELPGDYPEPLADLIRSHALEGSGVRVSKASDLVLQIDRVARKVFGPAQFYPFEMPSGQTIPRP